ncbi:alpha/beta hydrolase [Streptomyces sp. NPDC051322]|uniref:alpha/beta fold hydrolase n=1 Tax=Streptomyces sp. NPDC051322 TaxID=3154645 RepID=UPI003450A67C
MITDAGVTDYVLVGHSMGGKVAQLIAAARPAGLRGITSWVPARRSRLRRSLPTLPRLGLRRVCRRRTGQHPHRDRTARIDQVADCDRLAFQR